MVNGQFEVLGTCANEAYFKWTLNNFDYFANSETTICGPEFQIMLYTDCTKWMIGLLPKTFHPLTIGPQKPVTSANILLVKATHQNIFVDVDFKLYNSLGKHLDSLWIIEAEMSEGASKRCWSEISWMTLLKKIAPDDHLTLFITLKIFVNNQPALISELPINIKPVIKSSIKPDKPTQSVSSIIDDFAKFRISGEFSDLTISVRGKEFYAHKNILAARSPVFFTMFKQDMKEANSGKVEIEDIEPEAFDEFLNFIYTGEGNINKNACELLAAADKYDVQDLKAFCENELIKNLSQENCFKTLNLGELYSAHTLKKETINFIVFNDRIILDKNGLAQITNLSLSKEIIEAFVNRKK